MIKVKTHPQDQGPAGWAAVLPQQSSTSPAQGKHQADFLIIGAGFAGLHAAWRLHQFDPKLKIAVLEAKRVGDGPAGRNSGFMIDLPHDLQSDSYAGALEGDRQQIRLNRLAQDFVLGIKAELNLDDHIIAKQGKFNLAVGEGGHAHNANFAQHLDRLGEPYEMLNEEEILAVTGSYFYQSALFAPGTVMLQPAAYVRALAKALGAKGVGLYENSPVVEMSELGEQGWTVRTDKATFSCGKVLLTTNGHAQSFGFFKRRFIHLVLYASLSKPLTPIQVKAMGGRPQWGGTPSDPMGSSVRRLDDPSGTRILMRNQATYAPSMLVSQNQIAKARTVHKQSILKRWPRLKDLEIEFAWAGRLCLSHNGSQAFGEVAPNLISACCQNGLGTAKGTLAGMLAADLAYDLPANHNNEALQLLLTEEEPSRLPPEPFATMGAKSIMAFKKWQARHEL